jgi:large subunit ribosomal protein L35
MPKMKSHRGAAKRFKVTGTGKIRRRRAGMNHMLGKKGSKRKRRLSRPDAEVAPADGNRIRKLLAK